jgi:hypothetical protein
LATLLLSEWGVGQMARTVASLPEGGRITDQISLGVIAKTFPLEKIRAVLAATGTASVRERALPAHVMVYYVVAMALYMQSSCREVLRCLLEGVLLGLNRSATVKAKAASKSTVKVAGKSAVKVAAKSTVKVAGKSAISQARARLGWEPVRRLHDDLVRPIAVPTTRGAWYRGWRLVSLDGSTLDVADDEANEEAFGRQRSGRGSSAFPQIRFVSLVENGTHVLFGSQMAAYATGEITLAKTVLPSLRPGMLCLADRNFFCFPLWHQACQTGADQLWRVKKNARLPREIELPDGSYLSHTYPSEKDRRRNTNGILVRVIEYCLDGVAGADPCYRLVTTILDHEKAPAKELAALYHERWEIETVLDELKTHLRGARIVLRSKTPDLVRQEFYGLIMAHFAIRGLMHEAALKVDEDPDCLSFIHAVRVIRRKLISFAATPPWAQACLS